MNIVEKINKSNPVSLFYGNDLYFTECGSNDSFAISHVCHGKETWTN